MNNYEQAGRVLTAVASADTTSGSPVVVGSVLGVAAHSALAGESLEVNICGVYTLPKKASTAIAQGEALVYDTTAGTFANGAAATGNLSGAGFAFAAAQASDSVVKVKLSGQAGTIKA